MINISLPLMYYNIDLNDKLSKYFLKYKYNKENIFKITNLNFNFFYGSLPFAIWNGSSNINIQKDLFALDSDIQAFFNRYYIPVCIDCSNLLIESNDLKNNYQNIILRHGSERGNFLEISDLGMIDYIKEQNLKYNLIFSKHANITNPFTIEIINTIIEQDIFSLLELPDQLKYNLDVLTNIKNKNKIEITIGNKCLKQCPNLEQCILTEQKYIINYSKQTIYYNCNKLNDYSNPNALKNEIDYFTKLGFSHFRVDTPPLNKLEQFNQYLIENLITEEYQLSFLNK